jgi:hypothetical protein
MDDEDIPPVCPEDTLVGSRVCMNERQCSVCRTSMRAPVFVTADGTEWDAIPIGWFFWVRHGVVIEVCSPECATRYISGFGNLPMEIRR